MPVPITHPCGIHRVDYYGDRSVGNVSLRKLWITCCMVLQCHIHVRGVCLASRLPVGRPALAAVAHLVKIERGRKQRLPQRVTQQPSAGLPFADLQSSFSPRVDFIGYSGMRHCGSAVESQSLYVPGRLSQPTALCSPAWAGAVATPLPLQLRPQPERAGSGTSRDGLSIWSARDRVGREQEGSTRFLPGCEGKLQTSKESRQDRQFSRSPQLLQHQVCQTGHGP